MNKIIHKLNLKNIIPFSELQTLRTKTQPVLIVEIEKDPTCILNNSLWVGYRNGGMASWLTALLPHLPHRHFCLYMNSDAYHGSEYVYAYYSEYFEKLFHREFVGTCIHPRKLIPPSSLTQLNEIKAEHLGEHLPHTNNFSQQKVFLDFRCPQMTAKCTISHAITKFPNVSHINLPLNDEDLLESLHSKTNHLPSNSQFITMCAKGYRSTIGYSLINLLKQGSWDVRLCRNSANEIIKELNKVEKIEKIAYEEQHALSFS